MFLCKHRRGSGGNWNLQVCYEIDLTLNLETVTGKTNTSPGFYRVHKGSLLKKR